VLAFFLGTVTALDFPARQAFLPEMVKREELASAIALNSGIFNGARVIGPAFAGVLIAITGSGGAFLLNGISYIASITALMMMRVNEEVADHHLHPITAIKEGIRYSFSHPVIKRLLMFCSITSIFGWSYSTVMPVMAKNVFHEGASGLGYLYVATGLGALVATLLISTLSKKISPLVFILGGNTLFAVSIIAMSFTTHFYLALALLFFSGMGLISQFSTINTTIQHMVANEVRGRVMSIYTIMFLGLAPLGSLEVGWLSEKFGTGFAIRFGGVIVFIFGVYMYTIKNKVKAAYKVYKENQ
jgi:MFS family permease